jgi:putative DNA primase/helicase
MQKTQQKFIASSPKNPCPVCDRTKDGDCRITPDLVICHSYSEPVDIPGWCFQKYSSRGAGGGVFVRDNGANLRRTRKKIKHPNERAGERITKIIARSNSGFFAPQPVSEDSILSDTPPEETFYQRVDAALYSDDYWIAVSGILYCWAETHYESCSDEVESRRIRDFASTIYEVRRNKPSYVYATPDHVQKALRWVKFGRPVTAEQINPPGINCTNGVLELRWEGTTLITELVNHDPEKHFYLSPPLVTYDPDADPTEYERLIRCLDSKSRQILERTIAASLDLDTVRKFKGRAIRAALLKGDGSNGKDTLRTITQMVLGEGALSNCSATDFKDYDSGRKFPVYQLKGKRLNWPSENADAGRVDQFRGLRAAITGDPIVFEQKNRPAEPARPLKTVFLFNVNEAPNIVAQLQATSSRWTLIPFNKTYAMRPIEGQIQSDPRFKEDPQFIEQKILPAFLNRLIEQLQAVVLEGIDYSSTQHLFEEMQREASHLLQFAHDTGLKYDPTGSVTVAELWQQLKTWYVETGTLVIEGPITNKGKSKLIWNDQVRRSDRNVKGANQVAQRFLEIFPKARKGSRRPPGSNNPETVITGIKFAEIDQRDQRNQEDSYTEANSASTQIEKWVPITQQLTNSESEPRYPVDTQLVPSLKTDQKLEVLRNGYCGAHIGHVGQFLEKNSANYQQGEILDEF